MSRGLIWQSITNKYERERKLYCRWSLGRQLAARNGWWPYSSHHSGFARFAFVQKGRILTPRISWTIFWIRSIAPAPGGEEDEGQKQVLHFGNASTYTAGCMTANCSETRMTRAFHLAFSPDLVHSDFHLFENSRTSGKDVDLIMKMSFLFG
jgi:hypothetical protein